MKLLASTASPYARKVRIVLAEKKIECELQPVDVSPVDNPVNAHNPLGKIPTLVLDAGLAGLGFRQPGDVNWHAAYPGLARQYQKLMERPAFADTAPIAPK